MKTYDFESSIFHEADGPRGAFVKTADHFEAVAELETKLAELRAELLKANTRYHRAITQMSTLVEQLAKGVTP